MVRVMILYMSWSQCDLHHFLFPSLLLAPCAMLHTAPSLYFRELWLQETGLPISGPHGAAEPIFT